MHCIDLWDHTYKWHECCSSWTLVFLNSISKIWGPVKSNPFSGKSSTMTFFKAYLNRMRKFGKLFSPFWYSFVWSVTMRNLKTGIQVYLLYFKTTKAGIHTCSNFVLNLELPIYDRDKCNWFHYVTVNRGGNFSWKWSSQSMYQGDTTEAAKTWWTYSVGERPLHNLKIPSFLEIFTKAS